jgi:hypothetical protein
LAIFDLASEIEIEIGGKNYTIAKLTEISEKETIIISENDYKKL